MDAFFASVEQLDNPDLLGKPLVVGGSPDSRGVVAAASYEARQFGIHSAMSSFKASQLCKDLVFVRPRIARYREVSQQIHTVFRRFTGLIEPLSLDEAYLDVSANTHYKGSATYIAKAIKADIKKDTGLTASAGVSYNKFLAKLASDMDKPDGLFVIEPKKALAIIHDLPVKKLFGVGKVTAKKMHRLNIHKISDLARMGEAQLCQHFGKQGSYYYSLSQGVDNREVNPHRVRKSIGRETTFTQDIYQRSDLEQHIETLLVQVIGHMQKHEVFAKTITLKVKYHDFTLITRSHTSEQYYSVKEQMLPQLMGLLDKTQAGDKAVRLLGVSVSKLYAENRSKHDGASKGSLQTRLF